MFLIYKHTSPSGKSYIGQTNNLSRRNNGHNSITSPCRALRNAIIKYGWNNFTHEILAENLTIEEANKLESHFILEHNTLAPLGYNLTTGGNNKKSSVETKKKILVSMSGRTISESTKQKISRIHKGKITSEETKQKLREANLGKVLSEATRLKMRNRRQSEESNIKRAQKLKGRILSDEHKQKIRDTKARQKKLKNNEIIGQLELENNPSNVTPKVELTMVHQGLKTWWMLKDEKGRTYEDIMPLYCLMKYLCKDDENEYQKNCGIYDL